MKENFWTMLKVLFATGLSILIFNYFSGNFSSNIEQSSLIKSSLAMLNDILSESVSNNETGDIARRSFRAFSEKVSKGEISPDEFQDIAAAILNIRMEQGIKLDSELKKIILDMEFAEKEAELNDLSGRTLDAKYEAIALKIEELAAFQDENLPNLTLTDQWSKVSQPTKLPNKRGNMEIIVSYDPVEPISESPTSSITRREGNIIIIETPQIIAPLIRITPNLDVIVDSIIMIHMDSAKVQFLKKSLDRLQHAKTLNKIIEATAPESPEN